MALLVVGIGDCKVSSNPSDVLITHALGSCIAILLYDPMARVAGLLHFMLPESSLDAARAGRLPFLFADTGIPLLLERARQFGAVQSRVVILAAGGAQMLVPGGTFNIGQRNYQAMQQALAKAGIRVHKEDIGGISWRTVSIDVADGHVQLRQPGSTERTLRAEGGPCHP